MAITRARRTAASDATAAPPPAAATPARRTPKRRRRPEDDAPGTPEPAAADAAPRKKTSKRGVARADDMPLVPQPLIDAAAARLALAHRCRKFVGLHASAAGGPHNAVANALKHGGTAFALFLRSQRKWESPPLPPDEPAKFRAALAMAGLQPRHVLPHGSYLVNLGHADPAKQAQSRAVFVDDLRRCEALGIELYNFHPGAPAGSCTNAEAAAHVADAINLAHAQTSSVVCVLETMCGSGSGLCGRFEDLAAIIRAVKDKARVGVCMDTCHMFAAGYDVSTAAGFDAVLREFDRVVGLQYLRAVHLNGSKTPFGSKRDRHENLGKGFLGLDCFRFIMNDDRFNDMPLVLETPEQKDYDNYEEEIRLMYSFVTSN